MIRFLNLLLATLVTLLTLASWGESYRRHVEFEWDEIEGAKSYEVELLQKEDSTKIKKPSQILKTKKAKWSGMLTPGKYQMRLRSRDYRGVPGSWSPVSEFPVLLERVQLKQPQANSTIKSRSHEDTKIQFEWHPVGGASEYIFELVSDDGRIKVSEIVSKSKLEKSLPVATSYTWSVMPRNPAGLEGDALQTSDFKLLGKKLDIPHIETPENEFVRQVRWRKFELSQSFHVIIKKYNAASKKLEVFQEWKSTSVESIPFDDSWPGGIYQIEVQAKAPLRESSTWSKSRFRVQHGDRSPAAEYTATVRKSIDRIKGWYAIGSYLITEVSYSKKSPDTLNGGGVDFNAIGGTGRLGLGWFRPDSAWGFVGILDMSGFTISGQTYTYASSEFSALYRYAFGERGELRLQTGVFYKEVPDLKVISVSDRAFEKSKVVAIGPHLGAEYWHSITPKMGLQLNVHSYLSALGVSTPNGQSLNPTLSTQIGILGSYRLTPKLTGLIGIAQREELISYARSSTADPTISGDNEAKITGTYLNFFAEWSF